MPPYQTLPALLSNWLLSAIAIIRYDPKTPIASGLPPAS
jgi:hypothetical protein